MRLPKGLERFEETINLTMCGVQFTATWCSDANLSLGTKRASFPQITPVATITGIDENGYNESLLLWWDCHRPHMIAINGCMNAFNWFTRNNSQVQKNSKKPEWQAGFGVIMGMTRWNTDKIIENLPQLTTITTETEGRSVVGRRPFPITAQIRADQKNFEEAFQFLIRSPADMITSADKAQVTEVDEKAEVDCVLICLRGTTDQMARALTLVKNANCGNGQTSPRTHHKQIGLCLSNAVLQEIDDDQDLRALLADCKIDIICLESLYRE